MKLGELHIGKCYVVIEMVWVLTYIRAGSWGKFCLIYSR